MTGIAMYAMPVDPKEPVTAEVAHAGKSEIDWSPMTTRARPRYSASVPIVTASAGRPM